jgi:hypothetical protein
LKIARRLKKAGTLWYESNQVIFEPAVVEDQRVATPNESQEKAAALEMGPWRKLSLQDAIIVIAIYAARIDPDQSGAQIERIAAIAQCYQICIEHKAGIITRINQFVNALRCVDPQQAFARAARALNVEMRRTALQLAANVVAADKTLAANKDAILDDVAGRLAIDKKTAARIIAQPPPSCPIFS